MKRTLIAGFVAATLALGAVAPASAQQQMSGETIAKIAAGAAGLFILGKALENRKDRRREARAEAAATDDRFIVLERADALTAAERRRLDERIARDDGRWDGRNNGWSGRDGRRDGHVLDGPRDRRHVRGWDQCWREKWRGGKVVRYRDGQCMKHWNKGRHHADRPRECLRKRWTRDGWQTYWSERCLQQARHDDRRRYYRD